MSFTLDTWKDKAGQRLRRIGDWLAQRRDQDLPYLLYGSLCGMSLWPLVEASQGGEVLPAMMALGTVAGGIGGNLLAEQIQRWSHSATLRGCYANHADEAEVIDWVVERAPDDADLRQALDEVLEKLDAVPQAQAGLSQADRRWFDETLRRELARLGNLERYEAHLTGSGAIAQGPGAKAVGQGGAIVEGDVHGDVVVGEKHTAFDQRGQSVGQQTNVAGNYVVQQAGGPPPLDPGLTEGWNVEAIRQMLMAAFSDGELTTLCFDRFQAVYENFGGGVSKGDKVRQLMDYCFRQGQMEALLAEVERRNPAQYRRFAGGLRA